MICIPVPEKTDADYLIESDTVVLAREDQARPFFYEAVEVLKGADDGAPIDLFLDSTTRGIVKQLVRASLSVPNLLGFGR